MKEMESFLVATSDESHPLHRVPAESIPSSRRTNLGGADLHTAGTAGQTEGPFSSSMYQRRPARTIPVRDLHAISLAVAEDEQVAGQRILLQQLLGTGCQAVERAPQDHRHRSHEHPHGRRRHQQRPLLQDSKQPPPRTPLRTAAPAAPTNPQEERFRDPRHPWPRRGSPPASEPRSNPRLPGSLSRPTSARSVATRDCRRSRGVGRSPEIIPPHQLRLPVTERAGGQAVSPTKRLLRLTTPTPRLDTLSPLQLPDRLSLINFRLLRHGSPPGAILRKSVRAAEDGVRRTLTNKAVGASAPGWRHPTPPEVPKGRREHPPQRSEASSRRGLLPESHRRRPDEVRGLRPTCPAPCRRADAISCAESPTAMIRSPIAQFQCLFAQPWSPAFVSLGGPLRYTRLHEIGDQERGMRQTPSLDSPLRDSCRSSSLCGGRQDRARRARTGLNLHWIAPNWPAASLDLASI